MGRRLRYCQATGAGVTWNRHADIAPTVPAGQLGSGPAAEHSTPDAARIAWASSTAYAPVARVEAELVADREMYHDRDLRPDSTAAATTSGEPQATIPSTRQAGAARSARDSSAWVEASPSARVRRASAAGHRCRGHAIR